MYTTHITSERWTSTQSVGSSSGRVLVPSMWLIAPPPAFQSHRYKLASPHTRQKYRLASGYETICLSVPEANSCPGI